MRFLPDGPSIPDALLERCDDGRVVFLCGAGVSLPSGMPTFVDLTKYVIEFFDPPADSEIMTAFRPWLTVQSGANVPLDQIFNLLHLEYGKNEVNALVTKRLSEPVGGNGCGREHSLIKRISSSQRGIPQIVTTNFDRLFETATESLVSYVPPAFPDLNFGSEIEGITYLHGRLVDAVAENHPYVLSSADFGRAYLSEGWATNFIRHLLERYTVVLVGYKAEDPPVKYLLQGLNHDGKYDRSRLYAFDKGLPEEIEAKWRDRGVTAIAYSEHPDLWRTMEAWAERADDPRRWRSSIIAKCQLDPKDLAAHERGQVAHVLRSVQGARLLGEADPLPHPEWVCVLDANVRSAKQSSGYGENAETFDPQAAYGLDDDLIDISEDESKQGVKNDNLLTWRDGDDNPTAGHQLGGRQLEGSEAIPTRLGHLIWWLSKSICSPVLAWWAIRQRGLHPQLIQQFAWQLKQSVVLEERAQRIWSLILEYQRDPRNRRMNDEWFEFKDRVKAVGWTPGTLRQFRRIATPRLKIERPFGLSEGKPPFEPWSDISLHKLGRWEVAFLDRYKEDLEIPDVHLHEVLTILADRLVVASGLLADIEAQYFRTPTCYPDREVDGNVRDAENTEFVTWFLQLFDQLAARSPELARTHATTWPVTDKFFYRKLKLYAFNKVDVFGADEVAEALLLFDTEVFWDTAVVRELLFLLEDRWSEFTEEKQIRIFDRILAGPHQRADWSDEEFPQIRNQLGARYGRYLELNGCALTSDCSARLSKMTSAIPGWTDAWAASTVIEHGSRFGWVATDEKPDAIVDLPVTEIVPRAKEDWKREFGSFTEKRSFTGLVKVNPRKALAALTHSARGGDYPTAFWASMVNDLPDNVSPRLRRVFLHRVARLPEGVVVDLRQALCGWLEKQLPATLAFDERLAWRVYDHIAASIQKEGESATRSGLGNFRQGGKPVRQSRRSFNHAVGSVVGMCAQALFHAVPGEQQEAGSLIPGPIKDRIESLMLAPGEGSDHAVSMACYRLSWLLFVDPVWTEQHVIPMLDFEHPAAEAAWGGLLASQQSLWSPLAKILKPLLLGLIPWVDARFGDRDLSATAARWLGYMRVFHPDEACGLSRSEVRSALRAMSDDTRNRFVFWLAQVGKSNENGWAKYVVPLLNEDWPRERRYGTSALMLAWIRLLDDTGDSFPAVYEAVKRFLVPVEGNELPFYRFTRELGGETPITVKFPCETLDLMNRATPQTLSRPPYQLAKVLALIVEVKPELTSDPRYLRLIDLVERS